VDQPGIFVLEPEPIGYIEGDDPVWEREPLEPPAQKATSPLPPPRLPAVDAIDEPTP
jgi:hypothetical protein